MTMSSDNPDPPGLPPNEREFTTIDTISVNDKSPGDILSCVLRHEETGIPLVVRGLNADSNWFPLPAPDTPEAYGGAERQLPGRWINPRSVGLA